VPGELGNAVTVACERNWTAPETAIVASATHASVAARMRPHDLLGGSALADVPVPSSTEAKLEETSEFKSMLTE